MTFRFRSSSKDCLGQHPALVALHGQGEQPYGQFSIEGHREAAELDGEPKTVGITAPLLDEGQIRRGEGITADEFALIFRKGNKSGLLEGSQIVASGHGNAFSGKTALKIGLAKIALVRTPPQRHRSSGAPRCALHGFRYTQPVPRCA